MKNSENQVLNTHLALEQSNLSKASLPEENQTISFKTKKDFAVLLTTGIPFSLLQWYTIILLIATGNYLPFIIYIPIFIIYAIIISAYYFKKVAYICPQYKEVFVKNTHKYY